MNSKGAVTVRQLLADIRAHCLSCCGGSRNLVEECTIKRCRLWPYRCGMAGLQTALLSSTQPEEQLEGQLDMFGSEVLQ